MEAKESLDTYLVTLKEMLLDEEKLVTYVSLSKDLCIHVNCSKKLLCRAIESIGKKQLNINYLISGLSDVNVARTTVCTEEDLSDVRQTFKIIFFEHVYSASKGKISVGDAAFLLVNKFEDFALCKGYIKSDNCMKHTTSEINKLKNSKLDIKPDGIKPLTAPVKKIKQEPKEITTSSSYSDKGLESRSDKSIKLETPVKNDVTSPKMQRNGLSPKKQENEQSPKKRVNGTESKKQTNGKLLNHKMQKGIAGFFNKPVANNKNGTVAKNMGMESKQKVLNEVESKQEVLNEVEKMDVQDTKKIEVSPKKEKEKENKNKDLNKKNNSLNQIKKSSKVEKNRKRVLQVSDSDSEEENDPFTPDKKNAMEDSEDEIPPTPMADNIKITSSLVNPKKKRKIVDKTYMDDEGYILTKKVEVYESCSENEEDVLIEKKQEKKDENLPKVAEVKVVISPSKKNGQKNKKKLSPMQKGQATLTNFFKRK